MNINTGAAVGIGISIAAGIAIAVSMPDPQPTHQATNLDGGIDRSVMTDILSMPVRPGDEATEEVNVALGRRPTWFEVTGEAVGHFDILALEYLDGIPVGDRPAFTTLLVKARNTSDTPTRLSGLIHFVASSQGVDAGP